MRGQVLDLTTPPWVSGRAVWTHGSDYSATQAVAGDARMHGFEWLRYESVRSPGALCAAVLEVCALAHGRPFDLQEWVCHATRARVVVSNPPEGQALSWDF